MALRPAPDERFLVQVLGVEAGESAGEAIHAVGNLVVAHIERREDTDDVLAGAHDQELLSQSRGNGLGGRNGELGARQQALAAHIEHEIRKLILEPDEPLFQAQRLQLDILQEAPLEHDVEHGRSGRHGERIATKRRAVHAGRQALGGFFRRQHRAHGEATADAFGNGHDIRRDAGPFMREQLARAAGAGLDLVENEQQAVLVTQRTQAAQKLGRRLAHAAFALDGLDHDGSRLGADGVSYGLEVAEGKVVEAVDLRAEAFEILLIAGGGERRQRAAVEGALECNDAPALRRARHIVIAARSLDGAFAGLGARIAEEHAVGKSRCNKALSQRFLPGDAIQVRCVPELLGLEP